MAKDFRQCSTCGDYHWTTESCKPTFFITHEDYLGDEEKEIRANSHEEAAQRYAVYYNDEYSMDEIEISVRDQSGETVKYTVTPRPTIEYDLTIQP